MLYKSQTQLQALKNPNATNDAREIRNPQTMR